MSKPIKYEDIDDAVADVLTMYCDEITEAVNEETLKAANELKKDISADAPVLSGTQKKSWRVAKEKVAGRDLVAIVHSTDYTKVHLLEDGHLTRNGKRTKAFHYVSKNEEAIVKKYQEDVAKVIKAVK